ncbi:PREDICTED: RE1-silencing transcription factor-like, partial [Chinchilla lanigera]|uniref:RE1-silencing transcription factor-like n=1 Tax=Chinchilla lanigera TaxID=34839 RepID=UPI0006975F45
PADAPCHGGDAPCHGGDAPCDGGDAPCDGGDAPCDGGDAPCDVETGAAESASPPAEKPAAEEPATPAPGDGGQAESRAALASGPASASESQEIDEDEGIHSHDGSDLSDNMSEGSDDSGLHGARPVPQEAGAKSAKEAPAVQGAEGDFVCIFCDRSFRKEKDYSKHLNRHLVNVYFLEKAAKGQE